MDLGRGVVAAVGMCRSETLFRALLSIGEPVLQFCINLFASLAVIGPRVFDIAKTAGTG